MTSDVLLWNSRGEVTELTRANFAIQGFDSGDSEGNVFFTPSRSSGLICGVAREAILLGNHDPKIIDSCFNLNSLNFQLQERVLTRQQIIAWVKAGRRCIAMNGLRGVWEIDVDV